jgi:excisionase family DNA binding protein
MVPATLSVSQSQKRRNEPKMTETLHPVKEAAKQLGLSVWTLRKKAYEGHVASVKIGAKLLIPESEISRLIQEGLRPRRAV